MSVTNKLAGLKLATALSVLAGFFASTCVCAQVKGSTHIVLVGDAAATDELGWGWAFAACASDETKTTNLARAGQDTLSYRSEGLWRQALDLKPDYVLLHFGQDDVPGLEPQEDSPGEGYGLNLKRFIDEALQEGVRPVLVTPLARRQWSDEGHDRIESFLAPHARVVREIGREKDVPVIDLHFRSVEFFQSLGRKGCEALSPRSETGGFDPVHLNRVGGASFGAMVAMDCRSYVKGLERHFPTSKLAAMQQENRPPRLEGRPRDPFAPAGETSSQGERAIVVARDGSGDYVSLQEAIDATPAYNTDRTKILIKPGVYMGQIVVPPNKPNLTLCGTSRDDSIISYALTVHDPAPREVSRRFVGCGVVVLANGFRAENLTIRQVAGDHGQAIALRIDGDRAIVSNCNLLGWQDTLRLESGRHYLSNCHIEGRVDYIYGGATAWIERCTLHTIGNGYVTAASTPQNKPWGYVFHKCTLTGLKPSSVYLGRPWRPYASVTFLDCAMGECVQPEGWHNWRREANERTARYAEHGCHGPGAKTEERVAWARRLSDAEAARITPRAVIGDWPFEHSGL